VDCLLILPYLNSNPLIPTPVYLKCPATTSRIAEQQIIEVRKQLFAMHEARAADSTALRTEISAKAMALIWRLKSMFAQEFR
jgi:hypothetical protein